MDRKGLERTGFADRGADATQLARQFADKPFGAFIPTVVVSPLDDGAYVLELLFTGDHLHEVGERLGRICLSRFHHWSQNQGYTQGMVEGIVEMYAVSKVPPREEWRRVRIKGPRKKKLSYTPVAVMSFRPFSRSIDHVCGRKNGYVFDKPHGNAVREAQTLILRGR